MNVMSKFLNLQIFKNELYIIILSAEHLKV